MEVNKSKRIPCGVIIVGNTTVELSDGICSTEAILKIGLYSLYIQGDNRDNITITEKKGKASRNIVINKMIFERIVENAFNELWEEGEEQGWKKTL